MEDKKIRVAITHGDTNGIGYELIFKTFLAPEMLELCTPIIYGSPKVAAYHRKGLDIPANFSIISDAGDAKDGRVNMLATFDNEIKVDFGNYSADSGMAALVALERALADYEEGLFDVLVTLPVSPNGIQADGVAYPDQASFITASMAEDAKSIAVLCNEKMRIGLATGNVALKDVMQEVTAENLKAKVEMLKTCMKRDFRISNPRVAVLGLNPVAGKEEEEIMIPAINEMAEEDIRVFGPFETEPFFTNRRYEDFDAVLAMYHDQGCTPFMALSPAAGVELLTGLPLVCTSPNVGVSYDIAGNGVADESSLRDAIYLAMDVYRNRVVYDAPMGNPLPKLYYEKRDESEKVRFSIPRKHEGFGKDKQQ